MAALQRHQLAWLTDAGWRRVLAGGWDAQALDCLSHWAQQRLPLVVTRQRPQGGGWAEGRAHGRNEGEGEAGREARERGEVEGESRGEGEGQSQSQNESDNESHNESHNESQNESQNESESVVCLGLPAPGRWNRRRLALAVGASDIDRFGAFPRASTLAPPWPAPWPAAWRALCAALADGGMQPRVYGSHGWQLLTGLDHLRPGSDIDLCIALDGPGQADAVAALLRAWPDDGPRLDGELVFDGGAAVAWREWAAWRAGRTPSLLVKRLDGVALAHAPFWRAVEPA
jgi:phosphoribosyl-dephospho-CoA transferase